MKKSKKITLTALSTSFASVFLIFGNSVGLLSYSCYLIASLCVMIPFITNEAIWGIISFVVSSLIAMIFVPNVILMIDYFAFFGTYALVVCVLGVKRVNEKIAFVVKNIFYVCSIVVFYFFSTLFVDIIGSFPIWVLFILAFIFMNVYDLLMKRIIRTMFYQVNRIIKM